METMGFNWEEDSESLLSKLLHNFQKLSGSLSEILKNYIFSDGG